MQRPKFGFGPQIVQSIISELISIAEWVVQQKHFALVRDDPADNHVTDCAIAAEAEYLVTGDKRLLQRVKCGKTRIVNSHSFIAVLAKETGAPE